MEAKVYWAWRLWTPIRHAYRSLNWQNWHKTDFEVHWKHTCSPCGLRPCWSVPSRGDTPEARSGCSLMPSLRPSDRWFHFTGRIIERWIDRGNWGKEDSEETSQAKNEAPEYGRTWKWGPQTRNSRQWWWVRRGGGWDYSADQPAAPRIYCSAKCRIKALPLHERLYIW